MATTVDYTKLYATKGSAWPEDKIKSQSHYNDPLTTTKGVTGGNSRVWGDASQAVQRKVIDALITESTKAGLTQRETAYAPYPCCTEPARHEARCGE